MSSSWYDEIDTDLNACSIETLYTPKLKKNETTFPVVVGCYQLNEGTDAKNEDREDDKPTRSGELLLHQIGSDFQFSKGGAMKRIKTDSGVLDGKWLQSGPFTANNGEGICEQSYIYATANASGSLNIYRMNNEGEDVDLVHICATDGDADVDGLALSLAWDECNFATADIGTCSTRIVSSYSKGSLAIHEITQNGEWQNMKVEESQRWDAHTLFGCPSEVWTCCFASNKHYNTYQDTIISGGDDCKMKLWDLRMCSMPTSVKKGFDAGVTAVSYHPSLEHVFAVGSYDEYVRVWDMRKISDEPLDNIHVGGGVWRVKWHPNDYCSILVGAMHGGCRIVNVEGIESSITNEEYETNAHITKEFTEHKSMAYGADWIVSKDNFEAAASCSFYDKKCFTWTSQ